MKMLPNSQATFWQETELPLMSSRAASRAKTLALLESRPELAKEHAADCGPKSSDLLASYDHDTSSWRTSQLCLLATTEDGCVEYLETLPKSGMTVNGTLYLLPRLVPHTGATGYGLSPNHSIPTPTTIDHASRKCTSTSELNMKTGKSVNLDRFTQAFPTPVVSDSIKRGNVSARPGAMGLTETIMSQRWATPMAADSKGSTGGAQGRSLRTDVRNYPTPAARDFKGANGFETTQKKLKNGHRAHMGQLPNAVQQVEGKPIQGTLNPAWVCWLMGLPLDYLDLDGYQNPELEGLPPEYLTGSKN